MAGKNCPYCGRRISYFTTFHEKKKGLHNCPHCKKESKIKTDMRLMIAFIAVVLIVVMFMIFWNGSSNYNSFLGVIIVTLILTVFYFITPVFIRFVPLKKYTQKNNTGGGYEYDDSDVDRGDRAYFNKEAFNEVKKRRNTVNSTAEKTQVREVHKIEDVSEAHASSSAPLKKMRKPNYDFSNEQEENYDDTIKAYIPRKRLERQDKPAKPDGSKYTANRKL